MPYGVKDVKNKEGFSRRYDEIFKARPMPRNVSTANREKNPLAL